MLQPDFKFWNQFSTYTCNKGAIVEVTSTTYLTAGIVSDELHKMFSTTVDDCLLSTLHVFIKMKPLFKMFFVVFFV